MLLKHLQFQPKCLYLSIEHINIFAHHLHFEEIGTFFQILHMLLPTGNGPRPMDKRNGQLINGNAVIKKAGGNTVCIQQCYLLL